ncbi:Protease synthase and sporulation negative regulatory protein PAI 1 [Falsiruegeria litorea R37]|uniref:Protease synthase and sporulation negative regulatory protein PAI 1 n=1 Tax=Falsiruegeria litorea R37 TaxID=1200284 RepID=A0A1Y5TKV7_9RHOB|nr:GNAT family N-acetyltransferase [Falsiruegeria litorea]SLN66378.1 Protease synthase and sporulation negative regulatory protein PAI 1 [Falsiruegeria litorea R37]
MSLRPARAEDASSLAAIAIEVWVGTYLRDGVSGFFADYVFEHLTPDAFGALIADPKDHIVVSERGQGIDGFIRISEDKPAEVRGCSDVEIATLYLQPRHHGQGIGQALLQCGLEICTDLGATNPWLMVNAENTGARAFYARQGFDEIGHTFFRIQDGAYRNEILAYRPDKK